jgi:hypothetical protein
VPVPQWRHDRHIGGAPDTLDLPALPFRILIGGVKGSNLESEHLVFENFDTF